MDAAAAATAAAAALGMQSRLFGEVPVGIAFVDPSTLQQQQQDARISYDAADAQALMLNQALYAQQHGQFAQHNVPSALLGRKHAPDRRPLRFWQPFNDWWRAELTRLGRRPTSEEIGEWYVEAADRTWGDTKPTLQETRVHAKCLRSLPLVRDYFRNYRAKKKAKGSDDSGYEDTGDGDTEDGTDNGGSSRRQPKAAAAKRARLGGPSSSNPDAGQGATGDSGDLGPAAAAAAGYGDLTQAYQYVDPVQYEEYARQLLQLHQIQQQNLLTQLMAGQLVSCDAQQVAALLQQQQQQQGVVGLQAFAGQATKAAAAAAAATVPEGGTDPVSGAAGDDERADHESDADEPQQRRSNPAQADTATSQAQLANAAPQAAAADAAPHHKRATAGGLVLNAGSMQEGIAALKVPAEQQAKLQLASGDLEGASGSAQRSPEASGAEPMQIDDDAGQPGTAPGGSSAGLVLKSESRGVSVAGSDALQQQQQPEGEVGQKAVQEQELKSGKPKQQPWELDLRDMSAQQGMRAVNTGTGSALAQQQQLQPKKAVDSKDKPVPSAADLQAALFSAAAAAAAVHGSTAVSPYVQGPSAAAAAAAAMASTGGLNLADSPHIGGAVEQDTPHPGALMPEAAAAAMAAVAPAAAPAHRRSDRNLGAPSPAAEQARAISIDIDEACLLNEVEMGGMSHGELVTHVRRVQQELLAKRELLQRSFDQLRRTQDRLARRERKLAKEQQKSKQYQAALLTWQSAWQSAALPAGPAAQEPGKEAGKEPAAPATAAAAGQPGSAATEGGDGVGQAAAAGAGAADAGVAAEAKPGAGGLSGPAADGAAEAAPAAGKAEASAPAEAATA